MNILYTGATAVLTRLTMDASTIYGSGLFDISDFQTEMPVDDTVTFTCTVRSNGKFTPGS
jgi:predicted secreted protein